ncbi:MAG: hypothetical protein WDM86_02920 [Rhizomicrobium sp.]
MWRVLRFDRLDDGAGSAHRITSLFAGKGARPAVGGTRRRSVIVDCGHGELLRHLAVALPTFLRRKDFGANSVSGVAARIGRRQTKREPRRADLKRHRNGQNLLQIRLSPVDLVHAIGIPRQDSLRVTSTPCLRLEPDLLGHMALRQPEFEPPRGHALTERSWPGCCNVHRSSNPVHGTTLANFDCIEIFHFDIFLLRLKSIWVT